MWAQANIDLSQPNKFAASPFQYRCSFVSWGNTFMKNPISADMFDYDWGSINEASPWYENQPYGETEGCQIQSDLVDDQDVARLVLGQPWRMPSTADSAELIANTYYVEADGVTAIPNERADKRVSVNGFMGLYLRSRRNGALLFLPCCGIGSPDAEWTSKGSTAVYWQTNRESAKESRAIYASSTGATNVALRNRYIGAVIRPVYDPNGQ